MREYLKVASVILVALAVVLVVLASIGAAPRLQAERRGGSPSRSGRTTSTATKQRGREMSDANTPAGGPQMTPTTPTGKWLQEQEPYLTTWAVGIDGTPPILAIEREAAADRQSLQNALDLQHEANDRLAALADQLAEALRIADMYIDSVDLTADALSARGVVKHAFAAYEEARK